MQTVCAHCYINLPLSRQRSACILCTKCEQNWEAGKPSQPRHQLPAWQDGLSAMFSLPREHS